MARVLVTEKIADAGLDALRGAGHEVDVQEDLSPDDLLVAVKGANAIIIRSATKVTAEVLEAGTDLVVVGRAGVGYDNVDVAAATHRGVMVVNAPQSNVLSAAEHTVALLLALARNIPQAHAALIGGKWERSKWEGVELSEKTAGVVGLGRIGKLVAQRLHSFGMRLVGYDPYITEERARQIGVELMTLDEVFAVSDFVTLHLPKNAETLGMVNADRLARSKPGLRIVNAARGGIIVEDDLAAAIASGHIGGAAIDVYATEPTTSSPLFGLPSVVVTPHLAGSTAEAQDKAGVQIAEQVNLALAQQFVPFAVNVDAAEASETVRTFLGLAERLGRLFSGLTDAMPVEVEVEYRGQLADYDCRILTLSVMRGLFAQAVEEPVSYVNAPAVAAEHGVSVAETKRSRSLEYVNLITVRGGGHAIAGTLVAPRGEARVVMVDDHAVAVAPADHLLVVRNNDVPGVIHAVTGVLFNAEINVSNMAVGHSEDGQAALMVLTCDQPLTAEVVGAVRALPEVEEAHAVTG